MSGEIVIALTAINKRLDTLSGQEAAKCCNRKDFRSFLSEVDIEEGRIFLIAGASGYEAVKGSLYLYSAEQLIGMADSVRKTKKLFELNALNAKAPTAVTAVKLPGGKQTGHLVYIRPVDNLELLQRFEKIGLEHELINMLLLSSIVGCGIWLALRPIRNLKRQMAATKWNGLNDADIPVMNQPTEVRPLLIEFNQMLKRMRQASENQRIFAAALSHEFRTPATVVSGFIQSVLNKPDRLSQEQVKALEIANSETLRMTRLLSDLLDLSRADNNQIQVKRKPFDLTPCLEEVIDNSQRLYGNRFLYENDLAGSMFVTGDPDRLKQCLGNIIENASKYSPPESVITIGMRREAREIMISVSDAGEGIPTNQQQRIFERFQRAEGANARTGTSSSGLGLAVVKMFMEAMDGTVGVESEVGKGSRFSLRLPAYPPSSLTSRLKEEKT
jgi:signal transduction histidine kinase